MRVRGTEVQPSETSEGPQFGLDERVKRLRASSEGPQSGKGGGCENFVNIRVVDRWRRVCIEHVLVVNRKVFDLRVSVEELAQ